MQEEFEDLNLNSCLLGRSSEQESPWNGEWHSGEVVLQWSADASAAWAKGGENSYWLEAISLKRKR